MLDQPELQNKEILDTINIMSDNFTKQEILDIGEDPTYFIVKNKHKEKELLLRPDIWNEQAIKKE